jgi:hypothetical protein
MSLVLLLVAALASGEESIESQTFASTASDVVDWRRDPPAIVERSALVLTGTVVANEHPENAFRPNHLTVNVIQVDQVLKGEPASVVRVKAITGLAHGGTRLAPVGARVLLLGSIIGEYFEPLRQTPFSYIRMTDEGLKNGDGRPMYVMEDGTFSVLTASTPPHEVEVVERRPDGTTAPLVLREVPPFTDPASLQQVEHDIDAIAVMLAGAM